MLELLMVIELSCPDAYRIARGVKDHQDLPNQAKVEIIRELKNVTPECNWDAND